MMSVYYCVTLRGSFSPVCINKNTTLYLHSVTPCFIISIGKTTFYVCWIIELEKFACTLGLCSFCSMLLVKEGTKPFAFRKAHCHCTIKTENNLLPNISSVCPITYITYNMCPCYAWTWSPLGPPAASHFLTCQKWSCWKILKFHVRIQAV